MCGIAGFVYLDGRSLDPRTDGRVLRTMGAAIRHRGPDDTREMIWQGVGFVFNRLSIIDLSGGQQPFETPGGRVCAMINGEIYNHKEIRDRLAPRHSFKTKSDCEVIPYLYMENDLDMFEGVNGIFAMALLDREKRRLVLARDRIGVKPLFYCLAENGRVLVFGSELKALFAHPSVPRQFDWASALASAYRVDARPKERSSGFLGIEKLPAGNQLDLSIAGGSYQIRRYWNLPSRHPSDQRAEPAFYVERFRELLSDSVRLRLQCDVGFGVFLSGGIDSAAISALAASDRPFPTFSVMSRATVINGDVEASSETARHLGLLNHQVVYDDADTRFTPDDWRRVLWACELFDSTAEQLYKFHLHAFAKSRYPDLKVILIGQGSDEFLGGYIAYFVRNKGPWTSAHWDALGAEIAGRERLRAGLAAGVSSQYGDLLKSGVIDPSPLCREQTEYARGETWDLYHAMNRVNLDYHLWHEDRTAAAHGIENRVPFLDYRIMEHLARVPTQFHSLLFTDKRILREAMRGMLPAPLIERPKGNFFYGKGQKFAFQMMYRILRDKNDELIDQAIEAARRADGVLDPDRLREHVDKVGADPEHSKVPQLLFLINMGVLADMAERLEYPHARDSAIRLSDVAELGKQVGNARRHEDPISSAGLSERSVLKLSEQYCVVEIKTARQEGGTPGDQWLAENGALSTKIASPSWARFLIELDGTRTVEESTRKHDLSLARTLRLARQSLESGIVHTCRATEEAASR